jgi:hypothetical protein
MKFLLFTILSIVSFGLTLRAGDIALDSLRSGQKIRIEIDSTVTGKLPFLKLHQGIKKTILAGHAIFDSSEYITLYTDADRSWKHIIPTKDIRRVWIYSGTKRATINGAIVGAASGAGIVLIVRGREKNNNYGNKGFKWIPAFQGALCGGIVGAIIGAHRKIDKWRKVDIEEFLSKVKLGFKPNEIGLTATIKF